MDNFYNDLKEKLKSFQLNLILNFLVFNVGIIIIILKILLIKSNLFSLKFVISNFWWFFFVVYVFSQHKLPSQKILKPKKICWLWCWGVGGGIIQLFLPKVSSYVFFKTFKKEKNVKYIFTSCVYIWHWIYKYFQSI